MSTEQGSDDRQGMHLHSQCFIQRGARGSAAPPRIEFAPPEFVVLMLRTTRFAPPQFPIALPEKKSWTKHCSQSVSAGRDRHREIDEERKVLSALTMMNRVGSETITTGDRQPSSVKFE